MFTNTQYLRPVAIEGVTQAPEDSYEYQDWWLEQDRRCREGYSAGGTSITGLHYFYLNFWKIRAKGRSMIEGEMTRKGLMAPKFLDIDYEFFWEVEKARKLGLDLLVLKRRQAGYSFKIGCMAGYEFTFFPHSYTVITAGEEKFAKKTFREMKQGLNLLMGGAFRRHRTPNASDHIVAAYESTVDGRTELYGYHSEARMITSADPQALVGTTPSLALYEEVGMFNGIISTKMYTDAAMMSEGEKTGMSVLIGTGGEENKSIGEVEEMFFNPERYGLMAYENKYSDDGEIPDEQSTGGTAKIALFIPGYKYMKPDEDGNSDIEKGRQLLMDKRNQLRGDSSALLKFTSQFPFTPYEALVRPDGNEFPIELLKDQQLLIQRFTENRDKVRTGRIEWDMNADMVIIGANWFDDPLGDFRMIEPPQVDPTTGKVFKRLYAAGTDSYDRDKTTDPERSSFGACYIGKSFLPHQVSNIIKVCSYFGRPKTSEEFYEKTAKMCVLYGWCQNLVEYSNLRIIDWYKNNGFERLLAERPEMAIAAQQVSNVPNKYGIDASLKPFFISTLADHLCSGGVSKLWDLEDIKELIRYRKDMNSDRTIAMSLVAVHLRQMEYAIARKAKAAKKPLSTTLFPRVEMRGGELYRTDYDPYANISRIP